MSTGMRVAEVILRVTPQAMRDPARLERDTIGRPPPVPAPPPRNLGKWADLEDGAVAGSRVLTLRPRGRRTPWHIVLTHGGAYACRSRRCTGTWPAP